MTLSEQKWLEPRPVRLTIADFLRLDETGAFDAYSKTELIGGTIVAMNAQYSTHARMKSRVFRLVADAVDAALPGYEAWVEVSVAIPPVNIPQPDIVVTNFGSEGRLPVPAATVALVIEIADTTQRYDLGEKAALYATGAIPEYWVIDIEAAVVHRQWQPSSAGYVQHDERKLGGRLEAATLPLSIILPE